MVLLLEAAGLGGSAVLLGPGTRLVGAQSGWACVPGLDGWLVKLWELWEEPVAVGVRDVA